MFSMGKGSPLPFYQNSAELSSAFTASEYSIILTSASALSSCTNKVDGGPVNHHPLVAKGVLGENISKSTLKISLSSVGAF